MKNFETRIKKLETILIPKEQTIVSIVYGSGSGESYIIIEGEKFNVPPGRDIKEFVKEKAKKFGSVVVCSVFRGEDLLKDGIPDK